MKTMPLIIKEYEWKQTNDLVIVTVPLKGVPTKNVDILTSDNYIKASYPPYFFEIFLSSQIDENLSKCTFTDTEMIFTLKKLEENTWDKLAADVDKIEMLKMRQRIQEKIQKKSEKVRKEKAEKEQTLRRLSVQQQIQQDTTDREMIESKKEEEKQKVMMEIEEWKQEKAEEEKVKNIRLESEEKEMQIVELDRDESDKQNDKEPAVKNLSKIDKIKALELGIKPTPLPRRTGTIKIHFTEREFPTPSRESQAAQEEEWLLKQVEARRAAGFVAEDLRPEERNPVWLKDKADQFYKVGNYLGAVSAYSHAIKLGAKMPSLFSNRAAAHFALGNLHKALDDCSQALELMTPHVPANLESRAKCHARRAAVLCQLGLPEEGFLDFEQALKLRPNDPQLLQDIEEAKVQIKNLPKDDDPDVLYLS